MSQGMVHVVTRVSALPGTEEQLKTILLELIEPARKEPGCISYKLLHSRVVPTVSNFLSASRTILKSRKFTKR